MPTLWTKHRSIFVTNFFYVFAPFHAQFWKLEERKRYDTARRSDRCSLGYGISKKNVISTIIDANSDNINGISVCSHDHTNLIRLFYLIWRQSGYFIPICSYVKSCNGLKVAFLQFFFSSPCRFYSDVPIFINLHCHVLIQKCVISTSQDVTCTLKLPLPSNLHHAFCIFN